jgi:hypothetical protein
MEEKKTSVWVYVGIGCTIVVLLGVIVVGGAAFWGYRAVKRVQREMKDPVLRAEKVRSILGAKDLPEGYHAMLGLSVPYLMDTAILSDKEPEFDSEGAAKHKEKPFDKRGFIYIKTFKGRDDQKLKDYFEGHGDASDFLKPGRMDIEPGEVLGRGTLQQGTMGMRYVAQKGSLRLEHDRAEGIISVIGMDCPGDTKMRLGIWFGPDTHPGEPAAGADYSGTPADPKAISEFMGHFSPCGP